MTKKLNLHLIQWRIVPGDVEGNLAKAEDLILSASPRGRDLILLPELFSSGFYYTALEEMADRYESVVNWMSRIAARFEAGIAGSVPVRRPGGVANNMVLVDRDGGIAASYDKAHLFYVADEDLHFIPGREIVVGRWLGLDVGLAVCFDLRFPEMTRRLCDDGAQIVLVSAQWPRARVDHFRDFTRVRAMENQMFVVSCNSCGDDGKGLVLGGGSTVVGPSGEVKGVLGGEEGVLSVSVDPHEIERVRNSFPVLKVRRKDLWK